VSAESSGITAGLGLFCIASTPTFVWKRNEAPFVPLIRMNSQNNKEQVMLWRAAVMALGRALRHEYETKQEEIPEHIRRLVTQLEAAAQPNNEEGSN
jgi:hypothetical protein